MATKKETSKTKVAEPTVPAVAPAKKTAVKKTVEAADVPAAEVKKPAAKKAAKPAAEQTTAENKAAAKTKKVTFMLPKDAVENAETVALLGDFNAWDSTRAIALAKQKDGSFQTALELEAGRSYEFRFLIDGQKWENAWNAEAYAPTPYGDYNSVITVG